MGVTYSDAEGIHQALIGIPDSGAWGIFRQITISTVDEAAGTTSPFTFAKLAACIETEAQRQLSDTVEFRPEVHHRSQPVFEEAARNFLLIYLIFWPTSTRNFSTFDELMVETLQ